MTRRLMAAALALGAGAAVGILLQVLVAAPPEAPRRASARTDVAADGSPQPRDAAPPISGADDQVVAVRRALAVTERMAIERGQGQLTGLVRRADGAPLAGVTIEAEPERAPMFQATPGADALAMEAALAARWRAAHRFQTTTDAEGNYRFEELPESTPWRLSASAPGYRLEALDAASGLLLPARTDWLAQRATPVRIAVRDASGAPLPEAWIDFQRTWPTSYEEIVREPVGHAFATEPWPWRSRAPVLELPRGWYLLRARSIDGLKASPIARRWIDDTGRTAPIELVLAATSQLTVLLRNARGTVEGLEDTIASLTEIPADIPFEAIRGSLRNAWATEQQLEPTRSAPGLAVFSSLAPKRYAVVIRADNEVRELREVQVPEGELEISITLEDPIDLPRREVYTRGISGGDTARPRFILHPPSSRGIDPVTCSVLEAAGHRFVLGLAVDRWGMAFLDAPDDEPWTLVGEHPIAGLAASAVRMSGTEPWQLDFHGAASLRLELGERDRLEGIDPQLTWKLTWTESKLTRSGPFEPGLSEVLLAALPTGSIDAVLEAQLFQHLSDDKPSFRASMRLQSEQLTLGPREQTLHWTIPQAGSLTVSRGTVPLPMGLMLREILPADGQVTARRMLSVHARTDGGHSLTREYVFPYVPYGTYELRALDESHSAGTQVLRRPIEIRGHEHLRYEPDVVVGLRIVALERGGLLELSGVQVGDILTRCDGQSVDRWRMALHGPREGVAIRLEFLRAEEPYELELSTRVLAREWDFQGFGGATFASVFEGEDR